MANELMICMALETGKRFTAKQGFPDATGLIQFTDTAVADMNRTGYNGGNKITKEDLANLTAVQQLTYVKLYFDMWKTYYKKILNCKLCDAKNENEKSTIKRDIELLNQLK